MIKDDIKKSLLLLGGSQQQVIAIEKAKECGYRTVLCDFLPDNPGQHSADVFYQVSTTDKNAILEVAIKEKVDGVIAYSSDPASPTAGFVAEKLGLPSNPLSSINIMSEKHLWRSFLKENGFPCPQAYSFENDIDLSFLWDEIKGFSFPIVIKPTDSSGSKGVSIVNDFDELSKAISYASEFSRNSILIAEEYIERKHPEVVGGDVFVYDGEIKFWGLMTCLRDNASSLVPVGEKTPSGLSEFQISSCKTLLQGLVDALGIKFGELNVEILIAKNDIPYILELGSRAGGNMIPIQLSDASGIDLVRANVMCAVAEDPGILNWEDQGKCYATYVLHSNHYGIFSGLRLSSCAEKFCYRKVPYCNPGDKVEKFDGANKALGILFFNFPNYDAMIHFFKDIQDHVQIELE